MSNAVTIKDALKKFGDFTAVNHVSIAIDEGEFFTLLGPSGCGKTTLLRMIAGFNPIDGGEISIGNKVINSIPAHKRDIGMVFQNYAIFPHMNVFENVAYGLKAKKVPKNTIEKRVLEALDLVQIKQLKDRKPSELSGGQQQRVALARAVVIEPGVLLMDEPLSNLDAKLRVQMRTTIKKLQRNLGITTIYVTHDQEEALAISDRIAVMKDGVIMQIDSPEMIYKRPQNSFVSGFIGTSNYLKGTITEIDSQHNAKITVDDYSFNAKLNKMHQGTVSISVRPEQLCIHDKGKKGLRGKVSLSTFLGDFVNYEIELAGGQIVELNEYTKDSDFVRKDGTEVSLFFQPDKICIYDEEGKEALL